MLPPMLSETFVALNTPKHKTVMHKQSDALDNLNFSFFITSPFIYDRKNLTMKKDSPVDRGEEIFRELVKERVKVK